MEITRQPAIGFSLSKEPTARIEGGDASVAPLVPVAAVDLIKPGLEQIQSALGKLPHVDLEKVAAIKAMLASGELNVSSESLATAILTYHRGSR